uniref:Zinc-finger domain-containing protein n=1 Tax=Kalanchoe fedtschenkoi TaxID=63787 RepID=A0A7N0ZRH3_KALFE
METRRRKARIESDGSALEAEEGGVGGGYEESRKKRIEENKLRLQKLGILDLSQKLKSELRSPKSKSPPRKPKKGSSMPLMMRSSSRLKSKPSVNYSELRAKSTKIKKSRDVVVRIKRGLKPEIYTEEDQKLLGGCETVWTLAVDGYENGKRVYDALNGTSCHQCRQKTLGQHTECSKCGSGYGQLCGDCLYMRYGENVTEVSQNPNWVCPVCRDICNCSICRQAKGWAPTGNLYRKVNTTIF